MESRALCAMSAFVMCWRCVMCWSSRKWYDRVVLISTSEWSLNELDYIIKRIHFSLKYFEVLEDLIFPP